MLANSLLDHASVIYLLGEAALAAIHSLGLEISRVERFSNLDE